MLTIAGILYQNNTDDPIFNPFQVDLSQYELFRHEQGNYRLKSQHFNQYTKVLLSNSLSTGSTVVNISTGGDSFTGYILVRYFYEDGEGIIEIQTFNDQWQPSDGILNNYPLCIFFKQNPGQ